MEVTAVATRLGFVHASCGPSQVRDSRSNRKAAIRAAETLVDAGTDMNVGLLEDVDADERRQSYQELGLNLIYERLDGREKVRASLGMEFSRVGGGTRSRGPRPIVVESPWSQLRWRT
jgi:hypothetical protein